MFKILPGNMCPSPQMPFEKDYITSISQKAISHDSTLASVLRLAPCPLKDLFQDFMPFLRVSNGPFQIVVSTHQMVLDVPKSRLNKRELMFFLFLLLLWEFNFFFFIFYTIWVYKIPRENNVCFIWTIKVYLI